MTPEEKDNLFRCPKCKRDILLFEKFRLIGAQMEHIDCNNTEGRDVTMTKTVSPNGTVSHLAGNKGV